MVWLATDRVLDRPVVVELVHPSLGDDGAFLERFDADARRLATLSHPNVARLLDTGAEDGVRFTVREWVDGESLRARLERDGTLPPADACEIAIAVLRGLDALHGSGLLHLDVTSEVVLLANNGRILLSGAAFAPSVVASRPPDEALALLDAEPVAPELRDGAPPNERTDVFAVGALLFTMLTGTPPEGSPSPRERDRRVSRSLDAAVRRALSEDPSDRFGSALELADELERIRDARGPTGSGLDAGEGRQTPARKTRTILGTWLLVPVVVVVLAVATILIGLSLGELEVGGPLGIRPTHERSSPAPAARTLSIESVQAVDPPPGDGTENDSGLPLAIDGDDATAWRSENYFDGEMHKSGVGLLFDLGADRSISGFRLATPSPGWRFRVAVGDEPSALVDPSGRTFTAETITRGSLVGAGRYVMVWITSVVATSDGHRAEVGEFSVLGVDA